MARTTLDDFDPSLREILPWMGAIVLLAARLEFAVRYVRSRALEEPIRQNDGLDTALKEIRKAARVEADPNGDGERVVMWGQRAKAALDQRGTLAHSLYSVTSDIAPDDLLRRGISEEDAYTQLAGSVHASSLRRGVMESVSVNSLSALCSEMEALLEQAGRIAKQAHNRFETRPSKDN